MGASSNSAHTRYALSGTRFYHLRVSTPAALPLWWWALLLLALLLFLIATLGVARQVEQDVARESRARLEAVGVEVFDSDANGQRVTLSAIGLDDATERYEWIAESARCDTWAGRLRCPTIARVELQAPVLIDEAPAPALPPERPQAPVAYDFRIDKSEDALRLAGQVPTEQVRASLVRDASVSASRVVDELRVLAPAPGQGEPRTQAAASAALAVLTGLIRGEAHWLDGKLSVAGIVEASGQADTTLAFNAAGEQVPTAHLWLQVARDALDCNATFVELLDEATIHFSTGSAQIPRGDDGLLAALASLANQCPGALLVEGHTDNVGNAADNQALSAARAGAVVTALVGLGVDAARLDSEGFGETSPIASNESASGRAQNRRIVVRLRDVSGSGPLGE
ncbi:MAG: OmpA family protein [Pseudomonadota bacterium]